MLSFRSPPWAQGGELNPRQEFCNVEIKGLPLTSLTYGELLGRRGVISAPLLLLSPASLL